MATNTPVLFYRGAAATTSTTIYTVPANTVSILTDIVVASADTQQQTVTIAVDGVVLIPTVPIPSNGVVNFQFRTVIGAGKTITALAGSTNVTLHVSGVQSA
jgi:hypothetical protein